MADKEVYGIREWSPLTNIIDRIPHLQRGLGRLFPIELNLTCIDAVKEFLAIGSNAGVVFWCNRHTGVVTKLRCESLAPISCVKIVDSVEFMLAAGSTNGLVNIFQIQKELPPDLNLAAPCTRPKPIQRYTIRELHRGKITCCEWSKNGIKLYTGDLNGVVVLTEFNYQQSLTKSIELLSESYEIVQLSVYRNYLLVSTLYRSIICCNGVTASGVQTPLTDNWQITQIGKKDRKVLVDCGGIFLKRDQKQPTLICGRPGLRFWISDIEGNVEKTLIYREAVQQRSAKWHIPILNPKPLTTTTTGGYQQQQQQQQEAQNFQNIKLYDNQEEFLVTHDGESLYILNVNNLVVEAIARGFRKILDFCVCDNEIFVLEGVRSLIRLAPTPEKPNKIAKVIFNPTMPPPVPLPVELERAADVVDNAEECFDLPPIEDISLNIPIELAVESPRAAHNRRLEIFSQISHMQFEETIKHSSSGSGSGGSNGNNTTITTTTNGERKKRKSHDNTAATSTAATSTAATSTAATSTAANNISSAGIVEIGHAAVGAKELQQEATVYKVCIDEIEKIKQKNFRPKTLEVITTKPHLMDESFCTFTTTEYKNLTEAFKQHLPDTFTPDTLQRKIEIKAKSLAEELNLPEVSLHPITAEELRNSKILAQGPLTNSAIKMNLSDAYPKSSTLLEDAGVQTTPKKKLYYLQDDYNCCDDFNAGRPFDDLCTNLSVANVIENPIPTTAFRGGGELAAGVAETGIGVAEHTNDIKQQTTTTNDNKTGLHFMYRPPVTDEINSFLLDFRRAADPLQQQQQQPPSIADSNASTSSDWEFLDN